MVAQNKKLNTGRIFNTNTHTRNIKKLKKCCTVNNGSGLTSKP
jgi:hypothetical protein